MGLHRAPFHLMLALCAGACDCSNGGTTDKVIVKVDPEADFDAYATFRIVDELSLAGLQDAGVDLDRIPDDVRLNLDVANDQARMELQSLGLTEVSDGGAADLGLFTLAATDQSGGWVWECVPGYWWGYWGYVWDPCAWLEPVYVEYQVGSLLLGLADPALEKVVFGGLLQGVANGSGQAEERIRAGVHEMFESYPQ